MQSIMNLIYYYKTSTISTFFFYLLYYFDTNCLVHKWSVYITKTFFNLYSLNSLFNMRTCVHSRLNSTGHMDDLFLILYAVFDDLPFLEVWFKCVVFCLTCPHFIKGFFSFFVKAANDFCIFTSSALSSPNYIWFSQTFWEHHH